MDSDFKQFTSLLHSEIPLTKALGIECRSYDQTNVILAAPLAPNRNHKSTAFGGSLYSVAVTCGWGLLQLWLQEQSLDGQIVIYDSQMRYQHPVTDDFYAICQRPSVLTTGQFERRLRKKGMLAIQLEISIHIDNQIGEKARLHGKYVITLRDHKVKENA